jgi:hypothetical protein
VRLRIPRLSLRLPGATIAVAIAILVLAWRFRPPFSTQDTARSDVTGTTPMTSPSTPERGRSPNRLAREKSPYLLQHALNPVDWYPWGEEAFAKARREGRPIFLSIGYSTCHWCHVMEHESFESDSIAELLNRDFVAIKVDREERPDVDRLYMHAAQALGVGGGWPLNVFLTPDLKPFFGGTYFPPESRNGRPGLPQVLAGIHDAWTTRREEIERAGAQVLVALDSLNRPDGTPERRPALDAQAWDYLSRSHDPEHGGFGGAPKFPSTVNLNFLLRLQARDPERRGQALALVTRQLDAMRAGGIHDHLGGGFHRYATDRHWLVPHFEKMLYDQALIAWSYLEGYQVTGRPEHAATARGIFAYVARDLASPEGAFYSAEDADSEGEEGRFYVWTPGELESVLGKRDAALVAFRYGVSERGNFEHGTTILSEVKTLAETATHAGVSAAEATRRLDAARAALLAARNKRVRPHRDDKVLAGWNGLMISALARGARVLGDPALAEQAARAAEFLWTRLRDPGTGALARRWRDGETAGAGQLDDHAYVALGFVDLYAATHDPLWLERAATLTETMVSGFWDERDGGFWESPANDPHVAVRMKDGFDGAEMAGNSIAALDLVILGRLLDRAEWLSKAERTFDYYARRLSGGAAAMPQMLVAMDALDATTRHVVIAGREEAADTRSLIAEFDHRFLPHDLLILAGEGAGARRRLEALAPFAAGLPMQHGHATAYVCVDHACRLPTNDPRTFAAQLDERAAMRSAR